MTDATRPRRRRRARAVDDATGRVDPSCTLVSALRRGDEVVIGWVGDSRAYWLDAEEHAPADD